MACERANHGCVAIYKIKKYLQQSIFNCTEINLYIPGTAVCLFLMSTDLIVFDWSGS